MLVSSSFNDLNGSDDHYNSVVRLCQVMSYVTYAVSTPTKANDDNLFR